MAERLGITQVSANEMIRRLDREDLVARTPYKGVSLTPIGRQLAFNVIRRQRLWERFLVDHLKLCWSGVYDQACTLEHATPAAVTEALATFLGHPATCPHGNPIPDTLGELEDARGTSLDSLPLGHSARILAVADDNAEVLAYVYKLGLLPGQTITLLEVAPLQGPLTVQLGETSVMLGLNLACRIRVQPLSGEHE
jgi:DtxR family Mn-dependent transcriptional regulator